MFAVDGDRRVFFDVVGSHTGWRNGILVERPAIVVVHGGPGLPHVYLRPWISLLAEHYCVVYLDLRGGGWSSRHAGSGYPLDGFVGDVELVRSTLGVDTIVPLGHSFGGPVVMEYALAHPERLSALVLANAIQSFATVRSEAAQRPGPPPPESIAPAVNELMSQLASAYAAGDSAAMAKLDEHPGWSLICRTQFAVEPPALWEQAGLSMGVGAEAYFAATGAAAMHPDSGALAGWDIRPRLGEISAPTLVIAANSPAEFVARPDAHAEVIANGIRDARLEIVEGAGHYTFAEQPTLFATLVTRFLDSVNLPGAADDRSLLR